ncbi:MAG TPA: hypothetical protein VFB68_15625 [Xanthobacteraceae bacterium]|nr:hypothetical protein [Xanthobacteraceae bacterium]
MANQAPTITGSSTVNQNTNQSFNFTSLISANDPDGTVAQYKFSDTTPGAGHLRLNGVQISGTTVTVSAANLSQVTYFTGAAAGSNQIAIEAIDNLGLISSNFLTMTINVSAPANQAPTISGPSTVNQSTNQSFSFTSLISGNDQDGTVAQYKFSDTTPGAGHLRLNGVQISGTTVTVSAANLSQVTYFTGTSAGSNQIAIEAIDNLGLASPNFLTMTINVSAPANQAPTISGPSTVNQGTNQSFSFTSLVSANDPDGTVAQYKFSDTSPGAGHLRLNGVQISGTTVTVSAANLSQVTYFTGAAAGSNQIAIEAIDNLGLASPNFLTMTINVSAPANQAPTISGPSTVNQGTNQSFSFTSLISANDPDGTVAQYKFSDTTPGAGHLRLNGVQISGTTVTVSAANLSQVTYFTGASAGSNQIAIEAIDNLGLASPNFLNMTINVSGAPNQAPTISGPSTISRSTSQTISFTSLISGNDPDGTVAQYKFSDTTPGTDNGYLTLNGTKISGSSVTVAAANLGTVGYFTGTAAGSNQIAIEAIDNLGLVSSNFLTTTINVSGLGNQAPTISGPSTISRSTSQTISFTSLISGNDPDGSVAQYRFSDSTPGTDNGYLTLNGVKISGSSVTVTAANLGTVGYFTGTAAGGNAIAIEAIDNLGLASPNFLTTTINVGLGNQAPTISGPSSLLRSTSQTISFTSLISGNDPDGTVAQYKFSDTTPGTDNGYLALNGVKISGSSVTVTAANLGTVGYFTGTAAGSNAIAIEAIDNLGLASPNFLTTTINVTTGAVPTKTGEALVLEAQRHIGEEYFWGALPGQSGYANPNYAGPWDCAEFVSWTVNKVYGQQIGLRSWDAYTGSWADDAALGNQLQFISMSDARNTPGTIIFRFDSGLHHIAISLGNGKLIEANVNYRNGYYWSDDGTAHAPLANGTPPTGIDIGDVGERLFNLDTYSAANGWKAVKINGVQYTTTPVVTDPVGTGDDYPDASIFTAGRLAASPVTGTIETAGDTDWFKIDNLVAGHSYKILVAADGATPLSDAFFSLRDSAGAREIGSSSRPGGLAYDDAGGGHNALVEFTAGQSGPYYVVVGGGGPNFANLTGGYRVTLSEVTEPGGSIASATAITLNAGTQQGFVGYGVDTADYYSFTATSSGKATVNLTGLGADIDATLLNASGAPITSPGDHPFANVVAGQTYYIKVAPHTAGAFGEQSPYTIDVDFVPSATGVPLKDADVLFGETHGKLITLANFAMGAYHLMDWEPKAPRTNETKAGAADAYSTLTAAGAWQPLQLSIAAPGTGDNQHFFSGFQNGVFTNGNAAALVATAADALVISFRGTNDNGPTGFLDKASILIGGGTPDEDHWLESSLVPLGLDEGMTDHFALFSQLISAVDTYVTQHSNISKVYVTGHSLGGAMVNAYMEAHANWTRASGSEVTYEAVTFADPGYYFIDIDDRITNFLNDSDIINIADFVGATPGEDNNFDDDLFSPGTSHSMRLYLTVMNFLHDEGVSEDMIAGSANTDFDNFVYHVDALGDESFAIGLSSNVLNGTGNAEILLGGQGNDTLEGKGSDDLLLGGKDNDTYKFNAIAFSSAYISATGHDTIIDSGGDSDVIALGTGFKNVNFSRSTSGNDVTITLTGTGGGVSTITIQNYDLPDHKVEWLDWNGSHITIDVWLSGFIIANPTLPAISGGGFGTYQAANSTDAAIDLNLTTGWVNFVNKLHDWTSGTGSTLPEAFVPQSDESIVGSAQSISGFRDTVGTDGNDRIVGDDNANILTGGAGNDLVQAGGGDDFIIGGSGAGNDTYDGGAGVDTVVYSSATNAVSVNLATGQATGADIDTDQISNIENVIGGGGNDQITGNAAANALSGGAGNDTIDGGAGDDQMSGGAGADTYAVGSLGDVIVENPDEGTDTAIVYVSNYVLLNAGVEDIYAGLTTGQTIYANDLTNLLSGNIGNDTLAGFGGNDSIYGGTGNDVVDGGTGDDTMSGGAGNDTYAVDSLSDVIIENPSEGTDIAIVYVSNYVLLNAGVEDIYAGLTTGQTIYANDLANLLSGNAGNDTLAGFGGSDTIYGGSGNDIIDGGSGADTMAGGTGNDTYAVDSLGDVIVENPNEGTDVAIVYVSNYVLLNAGVENIYAGLTTGQTIYANGLVNLLSGNAGDDTLAGFGGNDTIFGGSGNDVIDGGTGDDMMFGSTGNDTYAVDSLGDQIVEKLNEGTDTAIVYANNYVLAANVENGSAGLAAGQTLTGNDLNNTLGGNTGTDTLNGGAGNDALYGGGGNDTINGGIATDTLNGGSGNDTFVFHRSEASGDVISDFVGNGAGAGDQLQFVGYGTAAQGATFTQIGATNQWSINSADGLIHDVITLANGATVHQSDYLFV